MWSLKSNYFWILSSTPMWGGRGEEQNLNKQIKFPSRRAAESAGQGSHQWLLGKAYKENAYFTRMKLSFKFWEASSHYGDQKHKWMEKLLDILRKNSHELLNYKDTICSSANSYAADYHTLKKAQGKYQFLFISSFFLRHLFQDTEKEITTRHPTRLMDLWSDIIWLCSQQSTSKIISQGVCISLASQ